jgi:hypothetical protein
MFSDGGGWFILLSYTLLRLAVPALILVLLSWGLRRLLPATP